jgi:anthranilate synthase component II
MKVLVIDNYDSFTYNLVQYLGELGADLLVKRNDQLTLEDISHIGPDKIVLSPGPGRPCNAGITLDVIRRFSGSVPILGVCLGHQAIGEAFGGTVVRAPEPKHGKVSRIYHNGQSILAGVPSPFEATRYHSLIVQKDDFPEVLSVEAWSEDGLIMGLRHRELDLFGVQFHPESISTIEGKRILENFLCCKTLLKS